MDDEAIKRMFVSGDQSSSVEQKMEQHGGGVREAEAEVEAMRRQAGAMNAVMLVKPARTPPLAATAWA